MSETHINQNRDQDLHNTLDISTNSDQNQINTKQEEREWGPGTPKYYKESWSSYMPHKHQEQEVVEQKQAPERLAGLKEFAQKVMKALNFKNDDELVEEDLGEESAEGEVQGAGTTTARDVEQAQQGDLLAKSMTNKISEIKQEAAAEYEETKDPLTRMVVELTEQLEAELQKETLDWNKIDLLVRQISILLVQKMANNDQVTIQEEIKMMQQDVKNSRETYNTKWQLGLGIAMGVIAIGGGLIGLGGGVAGMAGAASKSLVDSLSGIANFSGQITKGIEPFNQFITNNAQSKRELYNYELERDRSHKQTTESSLQGNKSTKGSQMSQRDRAIEAAYRAFIGLAQ